MTKPNGGQYKDIGIRGHDSDGRIMRPEVAFQ